jgi:putative effector of murein hydrolase LrgA (UPF0299 family)
MRTATVLVGLLLVSPEIAWSYVDPGATGLLYQLGYLIVPAILAALVYFRTKLAKLMEKIGFRSKSTDDTDSAG